MGFFRVFSWTVVFNGLVFGLGFVNQGMFARVLGPEGRGQLGMITTTVLFVSMLLGEWLNRGNPYVVGREQGGRAVLYNTLFFGIGVTVFLVVALELVPAALLNLFLPPLTGGQYALLGLLIGVFVLQKGGQAILLGQDKVQLAAFMPVVMIACYVGFNGLLLVGLDQGLDGVMTAWLVALGITLLATMVPLVGGPLRGDRALLGRTFAVGGRGAVAAILVFLLFRSDIYLIEFYLGSGPLGVYMIAVVFAEMLQRIPNIAGTVLLPKVLRRQDEDGRLTLRVGRYMLAFSAVGAAAIALAGSYVIDLVFSTAFSGAYTPLLWMLPGLVLAGWGSVLNTKLCAEGYPPETLWMPAVALLCNLVLNIVLVPSWGLVGAAFSTSVSYGLWALLVACAYAWRFGVGWRGFLL